MRLRTLMPLFVIAMASPLVAGPVYQIDINAGVAASSPTAAGWTGLLEGGSVTLDGIAFSISSQDGWRDRGAPNDLTRDFAFDDGNGQAVVMVMGGAGDLMAGVWQVEMWSWDNTFPTAMGPQGVYWRDGAEHFVEMVAVHPTDPVTSFRFVSDGIKKYDVFIREFNTQDRSRLNAVRLTYIPEPATIVLGLIGGVGLILRRRRKS